MSDMREKALSQEGKGGEKSLKVTDRRMFTADGDLREDYKFLSEAEPPAAAPVREERQEAKPESPPRSPPREQTEPEGPSIYDLITLLGEHASIYLRQSTVPSGEQSQHLELAKLHIDLLTVLKDKTAGNLDPEESGLLDDVIYRLKMGYASIRGF